MAQEFARAFYNSMAWKQTRTAYMKSVGGLCERCLSKGLYNPADIVHHRTELTPKNITDVDIALGFENLEALCRRCHAEEHEETYLQRELKKTKRRWFFRKTDGRLYSPPLSE